MTIGWLFALGTSLYGVFVALHIVMIMRYETKLLRLMLEFSLAEAEVNVTNLMLNRRQKLLNRFDIRKLAGRPWRRPSKFYGEVNWATATIIKPSKYMEE